MCSTSPLSKASHADRDAFQIAWVYATTNTKIGIELFCRIIAGYIWQGKVLANIWFFSLGSISGVKGLAFAQDLKLGIYCNVTTTLPQAHFRPSCGWLTQTRYPRGTCFSFKP